MTKSKKSTFLNNTRIELPESTLDEGDIVTVSQVGSSNTIFRTSKEYIMREGKLVEYTDEMKAAEPVEEDIPEQDAVTNTENEGQ